MKSPQNNERKTFSKKKKSEISKLKIKLPVPSKINEYSDDFLG